MIQNSAYLLLFSKVKLRKAVRTPVRCHRHEKPQMLTKKSPPCSQPPALSDKGNRTLTFQLPQRKLLAKSLQVEEKTPTKQPKSQGKIAKDKQGLPGRLLSIVFIQSSFPRCLFPFNFFFHVPFPIPLKHTY